MPPRLRIFYSAMIFVLLFIPGIALFNELSRRSDIWWTPMMLLVPLAESGDRVQVYFHRKPLGSLAQAGQLQVGDDVVSTGDIGFRFNNWDRIRAQRIPILLANAAAFGVGATILLLLVTNRLAYRGERV